MITYVGNMSWLFDFFGDQGPLVHSNISYFKGLTPSQLQQLHQTAAHVSYRKGEIILKEGEAGDRFYLIQKGAVQVYVNKNEGEVVLARLTEGQFFGEQALLEEIPGKRMASVRAVEDCELLVILHSAFRQVLNPRLKKALEQIGEQDLIDKFEKIEEIYSAIPKSVSEQLTGTTLTFSDGEVIFKLGDPADRAYFIVSGKVIIELPDGKTELEKGDVFGELAILEKTKRAGTAIAKGKITVLAYDAESFQKLVELAPEFKEYIQSLKNVYLIPHRGSIQLYFGSFFNTPAVTIVYHLENGKTVTALKTVANLGFMMTYPDIEDAKNIHFARGVEIRRKIAIRDQKIVSFSSFGEWTELNEACSYLLDEKPIQEEQIESFRKTGHLGIHKLHVMTEAEQKEKICNCMNVSKGTIFDAIKQGVNQLDELSKKTGAGLVCGTCRPKMAELLGLQAWTTVQLIEQIPRNEEVRSFRFKTAEPFSYKPGQVMVISALIDNQFIQRSYTLTSISGRDPYLEFTIKKEPKGYFSSWLFDHADHNSLFRVSLPCGQFTLENDEPTVCFVGGIGVTPAIAFAQAIQFNKEQTRLHIDYSARNKNDFILQEEWNAIVTNHKNISIHMRGTAEEGRITQEHIQDIVKKFPDAQFYICGPHSFEQQLVQFLKEQKIDSTKIKTEAFVHASSPSNETIHL